LASEAQAAIEQTRKLAARGDYAAARRQLTELLTGGALDERLAAELEKQGRTLEVLESVDVVRRLLRDGQTQAAARASSTILDALATDEYARLGVVAAALTLIGRAGDLARRAESGNDQGEVKAFAEYLGAELNQLGRDTVERPLQVALNPAGASTDYTLGDLLSRRPWQPNLSPALEAVPEGRADARTESARFDAQPDSPVIGRILIEQEERERVSTVTQPAPAAGGIDMFDIVGRAALKYWHVVLFSGLLFATAGYFAMATTPQRWESSALLQKTATSKLRAPITGEPTEYVPSMPSKTVLEFVKLPTFHQRISKRLAEIGWTGEDQATPLKYSIPVKEIGNSLDVAVTETGQRFQNEYLIEFKATYENEPLKAQAIAGAAADEFRVMHFEYVTREAELNLGDYQARAKRISADLDEVYNKRLAEFATGDVESIGVDIESRTRFLVGEIQRSRSGLEEAKIELRAAKEELEAQERIAERLPEHDTPQKDERLAARSAFLEELERELYQMARKAAEYGPQHPIKQRVTELQEDIEFVKAEIRELERGAPEDIDDRKLNPVRALAEDRVARARGRAGIAADRVAYLDAQIPKLEAELEGLRRDYLKSEALRRDELDLRRAKERTDVVIEELTTVKTSADRELALVSPAAPAQKLERETLVGIAVGLTLGLVIGVGVAIGLLRRRHLQARTV
jgi:hypothetical protein